MTTSDNVQKTGTATIPVSGGPVLQGEPLTFTPVYYDSPASQVLEAGIAVSKLGSSPPPPMSAEITSGAPYFKISGNVMTASGGLTGRPATGTGGVRPSTTPEIAAAQGSSVEIDYVGRITVTVTVPKGAPLKPGPIAGTLEVARPEGKTTYALEATFYGTIIGKITVTPETVTPGEPVQIEVLDTLGTPVSDPAVSVTVQGVPGSSRWEQYPTAGTRTLFVTASNGPITETATASVSVSGEPMAFTMTPPSLKQLPIIQAATVPGLPYAGSFTLGTPRSFNGTLVNAPKVNLVEVATVAEKAAVATVEKPGVAAPVVEEAAIAAPLAEKAVSVAPVFRNLAGVIAPGSPTVGKPAETSYTWDFGDGSASLTTQSPTVTHDFFPAVSGSALTHSFIVSCTAVHDNVTVRRTIVLHSAYGMCKQVGVAVPPVTGAPTYAQLATTTAAGPLGIPIPLNGFSASMVVHNMESAPIEIYAVAIVPMSDATSVNPPAPHFTQMSTPQTIAGHSASALGTFVPVSALSLGGPPANAFTVYYLGATSDPVAGTIPVRFSVVFRISAMYSGLAKSQSTVVNVVAWERASSLQLLTELASGSGLTAGGANVDAATQTITVPLAANARDGATVAQATSIIRAGLTNIAAAAVPKAATAPVADAPLLPATEKVTNTSLGAPIIRDALTIDPSDPPPVAPGAACYPDDISDADAASAATQHLVCQLTAGPPQTVTIPSAFQNAQAGDVILSPAPTGDGDLIAALFAALTPPQHHGHSGIMTANFYEITHCTASVARISANLNKDAVGIPTSLNSQMLQYGWPGSITQTIDEATNSVPWTAPEGATYWETSFNYDDRGNPQRLIPPLVVKPLPENEERARPKLRQAADLARSKGARYGSQYDSTGGREAGKQLSIGGCYYSFYNYTKPQISAGFTDAAPAAGGWARECPPPFARHSSGCA